MRCGWKDVNDDRLRTTISGRRSSCRFEWSFGRVGGQRMRAARFLFRRWVERHFALIVGCSIVATGCFVSATQNWLVTRNRWYETLALLLICFTLFRPGYWLDQVQAPFDTRPASDIIGVADTIPRGSTLRFRVLSQSRAGEDVEKLVRLTMRSGNTGTERLQRAGLSLSTLGDKVTISLVSFGSEAAKYGLAPGD